MFSSQLPSTAKIGCLLFDLDGTLIDSSSDLTSSVNRLLDRLGLKQLPPSQILSFVGEGVRVLITRSITAATGIPPGNAELEQAVNAFEGIYEQHMLDQTRLYPQVVEMLEGLERIPKAVVTNKARNFSVAILDALGIGQYFAEVVGGDCRAGRKPDPGPVLYALKNLGFGPRAALMVGDTKIDIIAGKNAGAWTCGFAGGFRGSEELLAAGADVVIDGMLELVDLVRAIS